MKLPAATGGFFIISTNFVNYQLSIELFKLSFLAIF